MDDAHVAVLLEDLRDKFTGFGELLETKTTKLHDEIRTTRTELHEQIQATRVEIGGKIDTLSSRMDGVQHRLTRVEVRLNGALPKHAPRKKSKK